MPGRCRRDGYRGRRGRGRRAIAAVLALVLYTAVGMAHALSEMEVKAAYLFNFAKFVEWPPASFSGPDAPLVLCLLGKSSLGSALMAIEGKSVSGRELRVRREVKPDELRSCHMVFVSEAESRSATEWLRRAAGLPVLTVGEQDQFAANGGIIGFVPRDDRVLFEINSDAANRAGLKISSQLLRLAAAVLDRRGVR